jgi:hypothetical protein
MRGIARGAAVAATMLLPMMLPAVPAPDPSTTTTVELAVVAVADPAPVPQDVIEYPGRLQGFAPPRWAWLAWLVDR